MLDEKKSINKILLISHEMSYTGAPNSLLNISTILRTQGKHVEVVTLKEGPFEREFKEQDIAVQYLDSYNAIEDRAKNFDFVIANTIFCAEITYKLQYVVPTVLFIREAKNILELVNGCNINIEWIKNTQKIWCVSEYAKEYIQLYCNREANVIYNCINDYFDNDTNVVKEKVHFLIMGTIEPRKAFDVAIKAFKKLPWYLSKYAVLHIVGKPGAWCKEYVAEVLGNVDGTRIIYHGEIDNNSSKYDFLKEINVVIVASRDESCSLVALEGAMLAKALIVTENVGAKYIVDKNGYVVKTDSIHAMKKAIKKMIRNRKEMEKFGQYSREYYSQTSTYEVYSKNIIRLLEVENE